MSYLIRLETADGSPLWYSPSSLYGQVDSENLAVTIAEEASYGYQPVVSTDRFGPAYTTEAPARVRISSPDGVRYIER